MRFFDYNKTIRRVKKYLPFYIFTLLPLSVSAQYNNSGISAGLFDSS